MPDAGAVGRVIGVGDDLAVADDQHAVLLVGADIVDQAGNRARLHPLLFRRRELPHLRGPNRHLSLLSFPPDCECMDGRKSQERRNRRTLILHDATSPQASVTRIYKRRGNTKTVASSALKPVQARGGRLRRRSEPVRLLKSKRLDQHLECDSVRDPLTVQAIRCAHRGIAKFRRTLQWRALSSLAFRRIVDVDGSLHLELGLVLCVYERSTSSATRS